MKDHLGTGTKVLTNPRAIWGSRMSACSDYSCGVVFKLSPTSQGNGGVPAEAWDVAPCTNFHPGQADGSKRFFTHSPAEPTGKPCLGRDSRCQGKLLRRDIVRRNARMGHDLPAGSIKFAHAFSRFVILNKAARHRAAQ